MNRIFLSFVITSIFISCGSSDNNREDSQVPRPVQFTVVGQNVMTGSHSFTGLAKAEKEASLSFRVTGTVQQVYVKIGDRVKKGQLLATLDDTDYRISYNQSVANVQSAKAQIDNAKAQAENAKANYLNTESNYRRFEKLYETNSVSLSDFEQAKAAYLSAQASYQAAQSQVEAAMASDQSTQSMSRSASNQVGYTRLTAPFAGVVSAVNIEPNEVIAQGNPIIELKSENDPNLEVGVPENFIAQIKTDTEVEVKFNSLSDHLFQGKVIEIGYSSVGSTYPVVIRLNESDDRIRPGMPGNATFKFSEDIEKSGMLSVPPSSVGEDQDGNFVYILKKENEQYVCHRQQVEVGDLTNVGFVVNHGLAKGDMVASAGLNVLREGMVVTLYQE